MTRTKRYAVALGLGLVAGFYVGARTTTIVLKDRIEGAARETKFEELAAKVVEARQRLDEEGLELDEAEWYRTHPIVERVEREEAEAEARATGSSEAALELLRRSRVGAGDTTLDALARDAKPRGG